MDASPWFAGSKAGLRFAGGLALIVTVGCGDNGGRDTSNLGTLGTSSNSGTEASDSADTFDDTADSADAPTDGSADDPTDGGDGDGDDSMFCIHECQSDADCFVDGTDSGLSCIGNLCTGESAVDCVDDEGCVAYLSGWTAGTPCSVGGTECDAAMQVCLDIEGEGHCAIAPNDFLTCADAGMEEIQVTDIDGMQAIVCGRPTAECHTDGYCWLPCQNDGDCASAAYPSCNADTGICECTSDAGCETLGLAQNSVCNAGICGCDSDAQCTEGSDVCTDLGVCGCSSDATCAGLTNPYDGGMYVCK